MFVCIGNRPSFSSETIHFPVNVAYALFVGKNQMCKLTEFSHECC